MNDEPRDPPPPDEPGIDLEQAGYVPPDPDELPPPELGRVSDVLPWNALGVALAWALVFLWFAVRGETEQSEAYVAWGAQIPPGPPLETTWRLLASTFLHGSAAHVTMNAVWVLVFGSSVEQVYSRPGFWIVYTCGGVAASAASLAWHAWHEPIWWYYSIGGSGVTFALGGALLASSLHLRGRLAAGRARALAASALFILTTSFAAGFEHPGTGNSAHAGGLVAGFAIGALLPISERLSGQRPDEDMTEAVRIGGWVSAVLAALALVAAVFRGIVAGY